ncbi:MAG: Y-family DNA polymerase [Desulfobulbus sp.]|nr:Y-family DNA polymerase [Desulfobulbus sp.]
MGFDLNTKTSLWALADCNNFYCSCERLFRPDHRDRPVVVLSNNDGCIVSRSNEAKALGIRMGEPEFKINGFLQRHNVAVFSSNYALYGDLSARVIQSMESLVPEVEQYSIDEAFIPLSRKALAANANELCAALRARILRWAGIPVTIGIGATRTLAKLAAEQGKKIQRAENKKIIADQNVIAQGVYRLTVGSDACNTILAQTPVGDIWGIGRKSAERLTARGIATAAQLAQSVREDGEFIRKLLSVTGQRTALELCGISCVAMMTDVRGTIIASRSFGRKLSIKEEIMQALAGNIEHGARRLRAAKLEAQGIEVRIRTSPFSEQGRYYENAVCLELPEATADTRLLLKMGRVGLDKIFCPGLFYAKAGVLLYNLREPGTKQMMLWEHQDAVSGNGEDTNKGKKLMAAVDEVNRKFGADTLRPAVLADGGRLPNVAMRRERLSPAWTTDWQALPKIVCG